MHWAPWAREPTSDRCRGILGDCGRTSQSGVDRSSCPRGRNRIWHFLLFAKDLGQALILDRVLVVAQLVQPIFAQKGPILVLRVGNLRARTPRTWALGDVFAGLEHLALCVGRLELDDSRLI